LTSCTEKKQPDLGGYVQGRRGKIKIVLGLVIQEVEGGEAEGAVLSHPHQKKENRRIKLRHTRNKEEQEMSLALKKCGGGTGCGLW